MNRHMSSLSAEQLSDLAGELGKVKQANYGMPSGGFDPPSSGFEPKPQVQKIKPQRSLVKDFIAGIDPTGTTTARYGVKDADIDNYEANRRRNVGMLGGAIGGAVVIPSAASALSGAFKGFRRGGLAGAAAGAVRGVSAPYRMIRDGTRARSGLRAISQGAKASDVELDAIHNLVGKVPGGGGLSAMLSPERAKKLEEAMTRLMSSGELSAYGQLRKRLAGAGADLVTENLTQAGLGLGLAGAVGAGSAGLQYTRGREQGQILTPWQRELI